MTWEYANFLCSLTNVFGRLQTKKELLENLDSLQFAPTDMLTGEYISGESDNSYIDLRTLSVDPAHDANDIVAYNRIGFRCVTAPPKGL